jgi:hypothetical protein
MNPLATQTAQVDGVVMLAVKFIDTDGNPIDISTATEKRVILEYPDGLSNEFDALFATDGTDGVIYYVTQEGDLNEKGTYFVQGMVVIAGSPLLTRNNQINNRLYVYENADTQ